MNQGTLLEAIRSGCVTLEAVQQKTRASTGCGGCECDVLELLEQALAAAKAIG